MVHDLAVGLHQRLRIERRFSIQHLIHADSQRPPVTLWSIAAHPVLHCLQDLWGDVVWCAHSHRRLDLHQDHSVTENCQIKAK